MLFLFCSSSLFYCYFFLSTTLRGTTETWTVSTVGTALKFVVDTVAWRGAGQSTSRLVFQSYVKC